jgi:hypothetical protein
MAALARAKLASCPHATVIEATRNTKELIAGPRFPAPDRLTDPGPGRDAHAGQLVMVASMPGS